MLQGAAFRILYLFTDTDSLGFAELCQRADYGTDLGGYYLRQLQQGGYVVKTDRGRYSPTVKGKQYITMSYYQRQSVERPRPAIILIAEQAGQFVTIKRNVQPFIGVTEWPALSVLKGQSMSDAVARLLDRRLGITGSPKLVGFFRRIDKLGEDVFDDKLFAIHTMTIPANVHLDGVNETGEPMLVAKDALASIQRPAKSLFDILEYAQNPTEPFVEHTYHLSVDDLSAS
jgi:hypothetical protein